VPLTEDTSIGTGELSRAVALIRGDLSQLRQDISARPTQLDHSQLRQELLDKLKADRDLQDLKNQLQDKAIAALEGWTTWALRLGGPALAGAVVGVLVNGMRIQAGP